MIGLRPVALIALLVAGSAQAASDPPAWTRPIAPFHVVGPIYYVGTEGLAAYLVKTRAGLILLDGTMEENVPAIETNIRALGYDIHAVKLLLNSHAHFDHAAGLAALKRDTGATLLASAADRPALESGVPPSETSYGVIRFPPVNVDHTLVDRRPVRLGEIAMTPILTPGHTPGCTSWATQVQDGARTLRIFFPCSITVAGNRLIGNKGYPGIVADFRRSFARLRKQRADVVLPAHPETADVLGRAKRRDAGEADAFVDPALLPKMVREAEAQFDAELAKQSHR